MRCYASTLMKCILSSSFVLVYTFFVFRQVSLNQVSVRQDVGASNNIRSTREIQEKTLLQNDLVKNSKANQRKVAAYKENVNNSQTFMNDLFISVKTTKPFHHTRLSVILRTWFILAREQTYIFSDADDPALSSKTKGHFINTNCSASHNRKALCCKMSVEFDTFLDSMKKWFCHFDDDNYVNVPQLLKMLQSYNPQEDWYLGKPSIRSPLEIISRDDKQKNISFWFATGGAGFCISRALALKMLPIASGGKFISIGEKIRLPDDVTMGYIIEHILKKKLTVVDKFHSHFEPMKFLKLESFPEQAGHTLRRLVQTRCSNSKKKQISFSYSRFGHEMNVLQIDGFDQRIDPTRFLSLHCYLFPNFSFCPS